MLKIMRNLVSVCFLCGVLGAAGMRWDFEEGAEGWEPNNMVEDFKVEGGILYGRGTGNDPQLMSRVFQLTPSLGNEVHIRMRAEIGGRGELFFTETTEGQYGGFSARKAVKFPFKGGFQWQAIRIRPEWGSLPQIVRLRLDIDPEQRFEIDSIAIVEVDMSKITDDTAWEFKENRHPQWTIYDDGTHVSSVMTASPLEYPFVMATIRTPARARLTFGSELEGLKSVATTNALLPGSTVAHRQVFTRQSSGSWSGEKSMISLKIVPEYETPYVLEKVELLKAMPTGADLRVISFAAQDYPNRCGKPCQLLLRLENGFDRNVAFTVRPRFNGQALPEIAAKTAGDEPLSVTFAVQSAEPVTAEVEADLVVDGRVVETVKAAPFAITAVPTLHAGATYVPQPRPAKTDYLVGSYYFPGYGKNCAYRGGVLREWPMLVTRNPWTKPVLGYYDEGLPEVVDWQIKWATEHGINFFLVDWYWDRGSLYLEHWIDAFQQAKYRSYFKWAIMWANHNPKCENGREDWIKVVNQWLGKYLKTPEYLWLNGKPAVFLWSTERIREDAGGSEAAAEWLALADKMAREAGLPGITFYAMNDENFVRLRKEGYVGQSTYHTWGSAQGASRDTQFFPFKGITDTAEATWSRRETRAKEAGMSILPVADTGWDGRPRHQLKSPIIYGRTPQEFKRHLESLKGWLDKRGQKIVMLAPWNEWTEGSYIEPCSDFGFEMLRAVREVFCQESGASDDTCPVDLGRPSYDQFPAVKSLEEGVSRMSAWDFRGAEDRLGWRMVDYVGEPSLTADGLSMMVGRRDPGYYSPRLKMLSVQYSKVTFTMAIEGAAAGAVAPIEVFWQTKTMTWNAKACIPVPAIMDGKFHTYTVELGKHGLWSGTVTGLRLDPPSTGKEKVTLQQVTFTPNF